MNDDFVQEVEEKDWSYWFEIPVADFERGRIFYETVFEITLHVLDLGTLTMGVFPHRDVGCAICYNSAYTPGTSGPLVYMNGNPDMQKLLDRIVEAGGTILRGKTLISPEQGYMALFLDSEGNRIALRSNA